MSEGKKRARCSIKDKGNRCNKFATHKVRVYVQQMGWSTMVLMCGRHLMAYEHHVGEIDPQGRRRV